MPNERLMYRALLALSVGTVLLAACTPAAAPSPTAAPKPAATAAPAAQPAATTAPAAKPAATTAPAAKPAATAAPAAKPAATAAPAAKPAAFDEKAVADFYKGKTVRISVAFGPGGGLDTYSRVIARHMSRYIPGNPNIIVENKPGAGGFVAANAVYNTEPKDGTVILAASENNVLQQALGAPGVQFDSAKFNWLGSIVKTTGACAVRTDGGINSIQDTIGGKEIIVGTTGPGSPTHDSPNILNATIGAHFKPIAGYDSIPKIQLAIQGKEVDGICLSTDTFNTTAREMVEDQPALLKVIVVLGSEPVDFPFAKGVPAAEPLAKTDEAKLLQRAANAPAQMTKPFAVAPEVPKDRVEALRKALADTFTSAEFLADLQQAKLVINPGSGQEVTRIAQGVLSTPPATLAKLKQILGQ